MIAFAWMEKFRNERIFVSGKYNFLMKCRYGYGLAHLTQRLLKAMNRKKCDAMFYFVCIDRLLRSLNIKVVPRLRPQCSQHPPRPRPPHPRVPRPARRYLRARIFAASTLTPAPQRRRSARDSRTGSLSRPHQQYYAQVLLRRTILLVRRILTGPQIAAICWTYPKYTRVQTEPPSYLSNGQSGNY